MKHKHFYIHLVESTHITLEIGELEIQKEERVHLLSLVDANIHSGVVSTVLKELNPGDKKLFLKNLSEGNNKKIWQHLNQKIKNAEEKIEGTIKKITSELISDIRKARLDKGTKS